MSRTLRALGLALCLLGAAGCASPSSNRADDVPETVAAVALAIFTGLAGWTVIP